MFKIFKLAYANIRKSKGNTVSLVLMFLISGLLLNLGLLVLISYGNFFNTLTDDLKTSNIYYAMPSNFYNKEVEDIINKDDNVLESQKVDALWAAGETYYDGEKREYTFLFNDADTVRTMSKWKFVGEHLPADDDTSAYVPYLYKVSGGYELNDKFDIYFKDKKISLTIKGFTEDGLFSSPETGIMGVYLPQAAYEKVTKELGDSHDAAVVFANLKKINKDIEQKIKKLNNSSASLQTSDITTNEYSLDLDLIKLSRTMMPNMMSIMIVAFAAIIVAVCLIVIRFRIGNSIEDDMTKIGSLKAIGYTNRQIISSVTLQFTMIAFIGSMIGIISSYLVLPGLSDTFAEQSGLMWEQGFNGFISFVSLCIIMIIVIIVAYLSARRINKLNPIVALRGGIITHSFQKNHMPLGKSFGRLPFILALKSILQNKKQSVMISIILVAVSFAGTFAVIMYYNSSVNTRTFLETPGIELSNAIAMFKPEADKAKLVEDIKKSEGVNKVQFIDEVTSTVDNDEVKLYVMEDYSKKKTKMVYKGRYPLHSNEIALAGHLAELIDKKVGDNVTVEINGNKAEFLVTGLTQGAYMGGMNASIRYDAAIKLNPNFKQQNLQIYLDEGINSGEFAKSLEERYGESLIDVMDVNKYMENGAGVYVSIVSKVGIAIFIVTIAVVILVLYFVISSLVTRKKRDLGIQKAIGFTTLQLMNQISLGFLPPVILGVCIGSTLGLLETNAIMTAAQSSMGIMKANYIITPFWILMFGAAIVFVSYSTSMLITYRIRKISAYALVSE